MADDAESGLACRSLKSTRHVQGDKDGGKSVVLGWRDLSFAIGHHEILKGVSGVAEPGRLTAVMGPSGSGKTTLLNVLSARQKIAGWQNGKPLTLSGCLLASGKRVQPSYYKTTTACVSQDNALLDSETPRECLEFSAYLRLSSRVSAKQRRNYVSEMLRQLNIENCADVQVGSSLQKGLSGGELKRTAVGVELISNPKLLLLDEPLNGLDSFNAVQLILSLKALASEGVPIVMVLHQPSSEIFAQFDDLIILHAGQVVFNGPAAQLADHFASLGYPNPSSCNPADHAMYVIQRESPAAVQRVKAAWLASGLYGELLAKLGCTKGESGEPVGVGPGESGSSPSSDGRGADLGGRSTGTACCRATWALLRRDARSWRRRGKILFAKLLTCLVMALVYGTLFFRAGVKPDDHSAGRCTTISGQFNAQQCASQFGIHVVVIVVMSFSVMSAAQIITIDALHGYSERAAFLREQAGGYYTVVAYVVSKMVFEALWAAVAALFYLLGTHWLVGLHGNVFVLFAAMMALALTCASPICAIGAAASTKDEAMTLSMLPAIMQYVFSGILVPITAIPPSLRWVKYACPLYYALRLVFLEEFRDVFATGDACRARDDCGPGVLVKLGYLETQDISADQFWWPCAAMCALLFVLFRVAAVVILSRKARFAA